MTPEQNERLTRIGPGTAVGNMLRRYWWPVWFSDRIKGKPVPVRLLGEEFVLFRNPAGALGLVDRACPHRGAGLELGRVEADGIRCCYHGWKFAADGRCLDMPAEPPGTPLLKEVRIGAYPVAEAAGLGFAYIGPAFGAVAWNAHIAGFLFGVVFAVFSRAGIERRLRHAKGW